MTKPFKGKLFITVEANVDVDDVTVMNELVKEHIPLRDVAGVGPKGCYSLKVTKLVGWKKKPKRMSR